MAVRSLVESVRALRMLASRHGAYHHDQDHVGKVPGDRLSVYPACPPLAASAMGSVAT